MNQESVTVNRQEGRDAARWAALAARSPEAESAFCYGVKTTRVFCRPNCPSRRPRRHNVVFFDSAVEALAAGFRACKRCQPNGKTPETELSERIERARRLLEEPDGDGTLAALARGLGMSPFHFHRLFRKRVGLTPKQYQSAHRLRRFAGELRRRNQVGEALYEAGFGSASRAYERISEKLGMSPRQYQKGGSGVTIRCALQRTSLGLVLLAATGKGVCALEIGDQASELRERLRNQFPQAKLEEMPSALTDYFRRLQAYLAAPRRGLSLKLDVRGSAFQRRVWEALQRIPPGKTATYQELARRIGAVKAARAVGSACAANPVALAIPCHRAVRANGTLGGYRWGEKRKRALLAAEK